MTPTKNSSTKEKIEFLKSLVYKNKEEFPIFSPSRLNTWQRILDEESLSLEEILDAMLPIQATDAMKRGVMVEKMVLEGLGIEIIDSEDTGGISVDFVKPAVDRIKSNFAKFDKTTEVNQVAISQYVVKKPLELFNGRVCNIYGMVDLVVGNIAYDIKYTGFLTNSSKYEDSYQHRAYLYALKDEGIKNFEYVICVGEDEKKDFSVEFYSWNEEMEGELKFICQNLLDFIDNL